MTITQLLLINLAASLLVFLGLWRLSLPGRDPSFIDSWWPLGMVLLAGLSFLLGDARGPHAWMLLLLTAVWGFRLGFYLLWRWRKHGMDRRYAKLIEQAARKRGWDYPIASLVLVFALQLVLQWIVALPVQLGMLEAPPTFGACARIGVAVALAGIAIEALADWQLARFKADPGNAGKVMEQGLWRYSRHPNHFGDACVWWGLYLIAAETDAGLWSFPGPILLTFPLVQVSGAPTLEGRLRKTRPDYAAYIARTSAFIPWPPKSRTDAGLS